MPERRSLLLSLGWLLIVGVALLLFPLADQDDRSLPPSALTDYYAARGQNYCWGDCPVSAPRTCISGDCPCFDEPYQTQCFAERKSSFASANPPRGELTGVCWASLGRSEKDPQSGNNVYRVRSPVYSRVRFNETQTLSKWARDDRDAGFELEVGGAWQQFILDNYAADFPATDGWNWSTRCVSLDRPRRIEDQEWASAKDQTTYARVVLPTYGVADTPEERAAEAKAKAERDARQAELKRIADAKAAEAARVKAAAEAKRRADIAAMEAQLGPGKRASAERLLAMNEQVAKYRPKVPLAVVPKPGATPLPSPSPARQCTRRQGTQQITDRAATREAAEAEIARARGTPGGSESIVESSVSAPTCSQQHVLYLKPPPVGKCLACISEALATDLYGWVKGQGYPPPAAEWVCKATVTFTAERCGNGPSKVRAE